MPKDVSEDRFGESLGGKETCWRLWACRWEVIVGRIKGEQKGSEERGRRINQTWVWLKGIRGVGGAKAEFFLCVCVCVCARPLSSSVMFDCLGPHGLQPSRCLCPWIPGKNTGVGWPFPNPEDLPNPGIKPASHFSRVGRQFLSLLHLGSVLAGSREKHSVSSVV